MFSTVSQRKNADSNDSRNNTAKAMPTHARAANNNTTTTVLQGVVACLTGFPPATKNQYHDWIESLGGTYTRDFHTSRNTHLIACQPEGQKYEAAMALVLNKGILSESKIIIMHVVQASWLEACHERQCRVEETKYSWAQEEEDPAGSSDEVDDDDDDDKTGTIASENNKDTDMVGPRESNNHESDNDTEASSCKGNNGSKRKVNHKDSALPRVGKKQKHPPFVLTDALRRALDDGNNKHVVTPNPTFSLCQFYLVGFEDDEVENDDDEKEHKNTTTTTTTTTTTSNHQEDRRLLGKLLRRGMGTVFWEFQEGISHVIVHDQCNDATRESISKAKAEIFGEGVAVVSPSWVIQSWENQQIASPKDHPAQLEVKKTVSRDDKANHKKEKPIGDKNMRKSSNLLRGCLFVLLRLSSPPAWMVDYDSKELEKLIRNNNGQLLSLKLLEALKADYAKQQLQQQQQRRDDQSTPKRKCHVICWGGKGTADNLMQQQSFALHPILSQIQRRGLCELIFVNPNWLQTCVSEQKMVDPSLLPCLFQPQPWAWRRLHPRKTNNKDRPDGKENTNDPSLLSGKDGNAKALLPNSSKDKQPLETTTTSALEPTVRISVTGFVGAPRTAIVQAIQAIGATYMDSMHQNKTTHLICEDRIAKSEKQCRNNQKIQKALEWGIHVVSADWLYHILQNGKRAATTTTTDPSARENSIGQEGFCEARFEVRGVVGDKESIEADSYSCL